MRWFHLHCELLLILASCCIHSSALRYGEKGLDDGPAHHPHCSSAEATTRHDRMVRVTQDLLDIGWRLTRDAPAELAVVDT